MRVLIIEDKPGDRAYLKELAPPDWEWIEAGDVQSGLAAFRQTWRTLDLVVVDIRLPDEDGHMICWAIRKLSSDMPILPFTATYEALAAIDEFGCLTPLKKPVDPEEGRRRLRELERGRVVQSRTSAVVSWLLEQELKNLVEFGADLKRRRQKVVVFATNRATCSGLGDAFHAQARVTEAYNHLTLRGAVVGQGVTAIVADGSDRETVCELAQEHGVPLVLVADTPEQVVAMQSPGVKAVLLGSDPALDQRLRAVVRAIESGEPLKPLLAEQETAALLRTVVPPEVRQRLTDLGLSGREIQVLWLLSIGMTQEQIAAHLGGRDMKTVKSHMQRAQRTLGLNKQGLERWVRDQLSHVDR